MSIRTKMILGIGSILFLVILAYAIFALRTQANSLTQMAAREAKLMAALVDRAVSRIMTEGKGSEVQAAIEGLGDDPELVGVRVLDTRGVITRSSRPREVGQVFLERKEVLEGSQPVVNYQGETVGVFQPILNRPGCHQCHPAGQRVLGFLNVSVPIPGIDSQLAQQWSLMTLLAVGALVAAGVLIALLFAFLLGRRMEAISHTMNLVEAGDLSARVEEDSEDELGQLGKSFNTMVAHLADARRQLEARHAEEIRRVEDLASLGKMAAGIAHEINNPLAGMLNCVRTLLKGTRNEEQRIEYLAMLKEGLMRIGRTVGQLLDFAREAKPQLSRTDLADILRRSLALLEHEMAQRRISFSLFPQNGLPPLRVDPHQIEAVFLNILMNAVEAMPNGGTLTVTTGLRERESGSQVEVRIADTGVGIPAENLPRIFDPFFTTKEVGKGTGLGLAVSFGIVRSHGGTIEVESAPGEGTIFLVALPVGKEGGTDEPSDPLGGR